MKTKRKAAWGKKKVGEKFSVSNKTNATGRKRVAKINGSKKGKSPEKESGFGN